MAIETVDLYGPDYYKSHCGPIPYDRDHPHWAVFFGKIADELVRMFRPRRAFDAGCAHGFLVEALWDRGVETWGRDISVFAISEVRADVRPYCSAGSLTASIEGSFDIVTCIEVLEHMTEEEGAQAIANMTAVANRVVFSSSPSDFTEPTHINVKPPIYWIRAFAKHNFAPVIGATLPSVTPYALTFERRETSPDEDHLLACAEVVRGRIKMAADYDARGALTARVAELDQAIAQRDQALSEARHKLVVHDDALRRAEQEMAQRDEALRGAEQELARRDEAFRRVEHELAQRNEALRGAGQELARRDEVLRGAEQELAQRETALADLDKIVDQHREAFRLARAESEAISTSTFWQSTAVLRAALNQLPPSARRRARQALKLFYWSATLQLGNRLRRRRAWLATSTVPTANTVPPVPIDSPSTTSLTAVPTSPAELSLAAEPLPDCFDAAYYLRENPDVARAGLDPLTHYVSYGRAEGRFPNASVANEWGRFRLADLCDPERDEPGPRISDDAFCISVLTPTYNTEPRYLRELFQALLNQRYANWEWVVADDGSSDSRTVATLRELSTRDSRVRLTLNPENIGISGASNLALAAVLGTHIALVDHDDLLSRDAFLALYEAWKVAPSTQLFFTDECKLLPDGTLEQFWPKPGWSPAYLENTMCLGHLSMYETSFLRSLGGFRSAYDGTQDFDLALRASLTTPKVVHLPIFAYLWRIIPGSAATDLNEKPYAVERQGRAVLDYARKKHPEAVVVPGWGAGYWRIIYPLPSPIPLLSIVIPTGGGSRTIRGQRVDLVLNCIRSFEERHFYPNCEYVVIHNGDLTREQRQALDAIHNLRLIHYSARAFNLSEKLNLGVAAARGEYLCLLNDDVEAITERGGEELVGYLAANPSVGAIGPMCLFEDGTIQQNGVLLTSVGPSHAGAGQAADFGGHQTMMRCRRESFCIGGAIMYLRKDVYVAAGGFDETLPLNYNDVDFGLRLREQGLTCVVDPGIRVYHFEGVTKVGTNTVEQERFFLKHPNISDPYFSRWFKQNQTTYQLDLCNKAERHPFGFWLDRHIAQRVVELVPDGSPKLSVCVSVYNQPKRLLEEMYNSALMQTYQNKELVIFDNGSSNPETLAWLRRVRQEERAIVSRSDENLGIEGGNRRLLELMTGDFFVAMDADDFLSVDALQVMAHAIMRNPDRKVFYSDEYKSDTDSVRFAPFFKPDFDPVLLMNCCYPAHLMTMEAKFLREIEAYTDSRAAWCHDYDTLTRALAIGEEPVHVREPIYAWRINPGSTASAETFGKPETVDSQRFVLNRLLYARGLSDVLSLEPNTVETSRGMWRLQATRPLPDIRVFDVEEVWNERDLGVAGLAAAAAEPGVAWIAILVGADQNRSLLELSAPAWFDTRVAAVGGLFVNADGIVRWSGGLFLPGGRLFDPYAGCRFAEGGYHGQLWCQRCVDVVAPTNVLIRADALQRAAARPGVRDADGLMAMLGLGAQEGGDLIAVTPYLRAPALPSSLAPLPLDRAGLLLGSNALAMGSRWYDGRLEAARPYAMPGMA
jgi:glycosyltransferase involved in cell wall biosynthesis/tetratricopeptide (TPR) repeat protein